MPLRAPLILATLTLLACGDAEEPDEAIALYDRIHAEDYRSFAHAPGYDTTQPSNTAHSDQVDIYVNEVVATALEAGEPLEAWPIGSLIVKDGFSDDGEHALIAAIDKRDDGWFWAEWTDPADAEAKFSGSPEICTDCHTPGSDFVRAFTLP